MPPIYSKCLQYSWSSNFAVNVLEDDPAKIESANFILLVKLGSRAAIGYYPLRERGAANIRIREYQYREYRGPTVNDFCGKPKNIFF